MIKQQQQNLANGPPGLFTRRSRDSLWNRRVRGDPPLIDTGNLTGLILILILKKILKQVQDDQDDMSGLIPTKDCFPDESGQVGLIRLPRNDDQVTTSSLRVAGGSVAICQKKMGNLTGFKNLSGLIPVQKDKKEEDVRWMIILKEPGLKWVQVIPPCTAGNEQ